MLPPRLPVLETSMEVVVGVLRCIGLCEYSGHFGLAFVPVAALTWRTNAYGASLSTRFLATPR